MPLLLSVLAPLLLAAGAGAQSRTPDAPVDGAFYAESRGSVAVRLFGSVRVRGDSVEVRVTDGSVARPWVSFIRREKPYGRVRLRAFLPDGPGGEPEWDSGGGFVQVLPALGPGEEHAIRPVRFVLPLPEGTPDRHELVFQVFVADSSMPYPGDKQFMFYVCGTYGALAVPPARAESHGCGAPRPRPVAPRSAPPVRPVCVEDPAAPHGMRLSDAVVERLPGDSALGRGGERRLLSEFRPRIVGYAAGPQGVEPSGVNVLIPESLMQAQLFGTTYVPFGLPRPVPPRALIRIGEVLGASVFIVPGSDLLEQPVLYVLLPDCTFQPYHQPVS